jgi:hypothetical protein
MSYLEKAFKIIYKGDITQLSQLIQCIEDISKLNSNERDLSLLYAKLLDRIFGEEVTAGGIQDNQSTNNEPWSKGSSGGWLRAFIQQPTEQVLNNLTAMSNRVINPNIPQNDPLGVQLIKLLSPFNSFMGIAENVKGVRLTWNLNSLPHLLSVLFKNQALQLLPISSISTQGLYAQLRKDYEDV